MALTKSQKSDIAEKSKGGQISAKQVAHEVLPSRHAMASITGGSTLQRSMNNYSKMSDDADGNGLTLVGMSRWA